MKNSKIVSTILSLTVTALFLLTALGAVVNAQTANATATQSFNFPYSYGTPQVPSDVGAQTQAVITGAGLNGAVTGPIGHIGSNSSFLSDFFIKHPSTLILTVKNGTVSSNLPAVGQSVSIYNVTSWRKFTGVTNSTGMITFSSLWAGYWYIDIVSSSPSTRDGYTESFPVGPGTSSQTFYLPSNNWTINVNNGGTGTIIYRANGGALGAPVVQGMLVNLWNGTGQTQLLGSTTIPLNGTVRFTNVNPSYTTNIALDGYSNPAINQFFYGPFLFSAHPFSSGWSGSISWGWNNPTASTIRLTGTVKGTAPSSSVSWSLQNNTTITGGVNFVNGEGIGIGAYTITFVNAIIYTNSSNSVPTFNYVNSTLVLTYSSDNGGPSQTKSIDRYMTMIGGGIGLTAYPMGVISHSVFEYLNDSNDFHYIPVDILNSTVDSNDSFINVSSAISFPFAKRIYNSNLINTTIDVTGPHFVMENSKVSVLDLVGAQYKWEDIGANFSYDVFGPNTTFYGAGYSNWNYTNFTHDEITSSTGIGQNFSVRSDQHYTMPSHTIVEHTIFNNSAPWWDLITLAFANSTITESVFNYSDSLSQWQLYGNYSRTAAGLQIIQPQVINLNGHDNITFSVLNNVLIAAGGEHNNISGNSFTAYPEGFFYPAIQDGDYYLNITNNTFGNGMKNWNFFNTPYTDTGSGYLLALTGPDNGTVNVDYNTFYTFMSTGGPHNSMGDPINFEPYNDGGGGVAKYNVFYNNFQNPNDVKNYNVPVWTDIFFGPGNPSNEKVGMVVENNWFLNLNNATMPYAEQLLATTVTSSISGNHYFYSPLKGADYVPVNILNQKYVTLTNIGGHWNATYSMGLMVGETYVLGTNGQYVYNSSVTSSFDDDYIPGGPNQTSYWYIIAPDVMQNGNALTISYSNGLVGGPQPNFTWDGYKYTESVEPSYIQVGVNSANAPPVNLQFNGAPDTAYSIAMYDHGQLIDYTNVTSSANGVVTFTYNPATMPLDPVFELTTFHIVTSGSTAVPPEVFLYVLLAGGALLGAGAIIVSAVDRRRYR